MKKHFFLLIVLLACLSTYQSAVAQTYTNQYPKELKKIADKWVKKGEWKNGFTKAIPAPMVNTVEFYLQYHKNPTQWQQLFEWLEKTDLLAISSGKQQIPGTNLVVSVEDSENWCSEEDLKAGKGSESHWQKIDFMYVVKGKEGFCRLDHETSTPNIEYLAKKDRMEYTFDASRLERIESIDGTFNIFFPCDWHVAKVKTQSDSQRLRVLVVKMQNIF